MGRFSDLSANVNENVQRCASLSTGKKSIPGLAIWVVGCSVILHGLVSVLLGPMVYNDSIRYAPLGGSLPPFDLLGTDGNAAPLVQIVWRLESSVPLVIQALASGAAWAFVTYTGLVVIRSRLFATAWVALLTVIFWSPLIIFADASILTESLAISGSLACLACAMRLANERARSAVPVRLACVVAIVGFGVAVLSRPVTVVALAPTVIMSCVIAWRRGRQFALLISAIVILGILAYGFVLNTNAARSPAEVYRAQNRLALRASPQWIEAAKRTGFADCPALRSFETYFVGRPGLCMGFNRTPKFRRSARGPDIDAATRVRKHSVLE